MQAMTGRARMREIETPSGMARAYVAAHRGRVRRGLVVLGHGAGGGIEAPDLVAVNEALTGAGWEVARVEQPYRVKGRRAPEAAPRLDAAWIPTVAALRGRRRGPLVVGGRSSGARVACRTAHQVRADAVLALAFPLHPPGRPEKSRAPELIALDVPALVVQGDRDAFGTAADLPGGPTVVTVRGDHSLRQDASAVAAAVLGWIAGIGSETYVLEQL
jgi:hypothetical protein